MGFGGSGEGGNARSFGVTGEGLMMEPHGFRQFHVNFDGFLGLAWVYKGFSMGSCLGHLAVAPRRG